MQLTNRRTLLEAIARAPETGDLARLRALELLERLDERAASEELPEQPDLAAELADQPEKLHRVIELAAESGLFDGLPGFEARVERRARQLVDEQARARRAEMAALGAEEAQDAPEGEDWTNESSEATEAASGPEIAPQLHPLDEAALRIIADDEPPQASLLSRRKSY